MSTRPVLAQVIEGKQLPQHERERAQSVVDVLANVRFLEFSSERMREPAFPGQTKLGDRGENLPAVVKALCADTRHERALIDWMRELTPMDVRSFAFPDDPSGRVHLRIQEAGREISADSASDGTLRFIAMLAALL